MKIKAPLEAEEAKVLVRWLRIRNIPFTHIPNETGHTEEAKRRAIRMKQAGTSRGFPDYIVFLVGIGTIYIELKRQSGSVTSEQQKEWVDIINKVPGSEAIIAKGAQAAIDFIESVRVGAKLPALVDHSDASEQF